MIQDIAPHQYDLSYGHPVPQDQDYVLYIKSNQTLLRKKGEENHEIPRFSDFPEEMEALKKQAYYLFSIDGLRYFYVSSLLEKKAGEEYELCPTSAFRKMKPMHQAFAGITATQIHRWKESRKFCGCCGSRTEDSRTERALVCTKCGHTEYPKICPAVIVAVTDGDRLLMSRYKGRAYRGYALIAGFVEIGETFEETVRREVMEEVGLKVKNIRYYKSQPWAFTDTEMIGFFAELDGDDAIRLQEDELSEAGWYRRDEIPEDVSSISVGSEMKMAFKHQRI